MTSVATILGYTLAALVLLVAGAFLMDWIGARKMRERRILARHRLRALMALTAHRRNLEELALETERRRAELRQRREVTH